MWVTMGTKEETGLRFSRGGRSGLGLFVVKPAVGRKDILSEASMALYVEVSESIEAVLEWIPESNEMGPSSAMRKEADDWTIGDLNSERRVGFWRSTGQRMVLPESQLLFTRCGIHARSTRKLRVCLKPLLYGINP